MLEKALYATSLKSLRGIGGDYSRVYFGAEFCQWRMPAPASVKEAFLRASGAGLGFTMLTPWVTDAGLKKLKGAFAALCALADTAATPVEVVVNDFGVLVTLREDYPALIPVLGRLLVKQKRCPRIPGIIGGMPDAGREVYMRAGIEDPVTAGFLRRLGVKRVELDNPLQGLAADLKKARLKGSLYTPYVYVTTTRHCPASFDGVTWRAFTGCKTRHCLRNVLLLKNPAHGSPLIMRGNTQFIENREVPAGLADMGVDRIVFMEEAP